jgi:hypothetical protein
MGKNFNLALTITANTATAQQAVKGLTDDLKKLGASSSTSGSAGFSGMGSTAKSVFGSITSGVVGVGGVIKSVLGGALSAVKLGFGALAGAGASAAAALYAGYKAIQPAAQMEQYKIQLEVMLGTGEAEKRLQYLRDFAATTPFELPQVVEASNLMQAFGIYSERALSAAGDAASAFGGDLDQVIRALNYLAAGRGGEAFESLARIGVTRDKLKPMGIQFSASGELLSDTKQAFDAVIQYFETNFGGMMARQSKSFKGAFSNVKDSIFNAFADGGKGALAYLVPALQTASTLISTIGAKVAAFDWSGVGTKFLAGFNTAANLIATITSDTAQGKDMRNSASNLAGAMWDNLKNLPKALLVSLGAFAGQFAKTLGDTLAAGFQVMAGVFQVAWSALATILESFGKAAGNRIGDKLGLDKEGLKRDRGLAAKFATEEVMRRPGLDFATAYNAEFERRRYGIDTPSAGFDSLTKTFGVGGTDKAIAGLRAIGANTGEAFRAAMGAQGGLGDWWNDASGDFSRSNIVQAVKADYRAQIGAVPQAVAANAAQDTRNVGGRTQEEQLAILKAINAALREGIPAIAK